MKLIAGMHRSGTSLVAAVFFDAGADMGDSSGFYSPDRWNPEGYFEQKQIHAINMPLINGPFWKFSYFFLPSTRTVTRRALRMAPRIEKAIDSFGDKVVKENRFCLTLPAWQRYGLEVNRLLVCFRHPLGVARSLRRRNHITWRHAFRLWRIHHQRLMENTGGVRQRFIWYERLLDPDTFVDEMAPALRFFDIDCDLARLEKIKSERVRTSMNHNQGPDRELPPDIEALWKKLLDQRREHNEKGLGEAP